MIIVVTVSVSYGGIEVNTHCEETKRVLDLIREELEQISPDIRRINELSSMALTVETVFQGRRRFDQERNKVMGSAGSTSGRVTVLSTEVVL